MLNNLSKLMAQHGPIKPLPDGTPAEQAAELIRRCDEREKRLCEKALEAERAGDTDAVWLAMAARASNNRFKARLQQEQTDLTKHQQPSTSACTETKKE